VTSVPRHLLLLAVLLVLLAFPGAAFGSPLDVIRDCNQDGQLNGHYSNRELRKALDNLPSDIDEYSDCREVIGAAITGGSGGGGNGGGSGSGGSGGGANGGAAGGSAAALTPEEQAARAQDQADLQALTSPNSREHQPPIDVGGEKVKPGSNGVFDLASASNSLPTPLLVALIALAVLAISGGAVALRGRVPALARLPLISKIPTPRVSLPRFRR
jgi:hypothetical protein